MKIKTQMTLAMLAVLLEKAVVNIGSIVVVLALLSLAFWWIAALITG